MKIEVSSNIQQTKTELDEKFFSIADPAFIFDLLRNKIYSNPVSAVCREITCNALDAHREVGKGDIPIAISIPSYSDLYYKVKDYGPGISPDRMDNIFLNYGASTKRDTNNQIGGFGLGAKSPFAYSDSFTIITNYNGKCYNYCAFIDESKVGKLILLSETETTDPNGTEIIIPVKDADVHNFINWTEHATRHWKVKPQFLDRQLNYKQPKPIVQGTNWFAAASVDQYAYNKQIKAIVGEIEYPLDFNALRSFSNLDIMNMLGQDLYLKFQVGEVALAANRESVYLDVATKEILKERIDAAKEEFKASITSKIDALPSLWDANVFVANELSSLCANPASLGDITWGGIKVKGYLSGGSDFSIIDFHKKDMYAGQFKISKHTGSSIRFSNKTKLVIHDCGENEPNTKHVKKFFEEDTNLRAIALLVANPGYDINDIIEKYNIELMNPDYLSRFNSDVKAKKSINRTTVFQYMGGHTPFGMTSAKDIAADPKEKVLCFLRKDNYRNTREPYRKDKITPLGNHLLKLIQKIAPESSIYGIDSETSPEKIKAIFKSYVTIDDVIARLSSTYTKDWYMESHWAQNQQVRSNSKFVRYYADKIIGKIENPDNLLIKLISMSEEIEKMNAARKEHLDICASLQHYPATNEEIEEYEKSRESSSLQAIWEKIKVKYPLIKLLDESYNVSEEYQNAAAEYINMIDSKDRA